MHVKGIDYDLPDLSSFTDATEVQKQLAAKFTRMKHCVVAGQPSARTVWLTVGVQHFQIGHYVDDEREASWTCWMRAKAIEAIQKQ